MFDAAAARSAADSVYGYITRTAERSAEGASWETLSYRNEPIRRHDLWDGVPGIALFLADYALVTGSTEGAQLAADALGWSMAHAQSDPPPEPGRELGVGRGGAGLALAYLHLASVVPSALDRALEQARLVAASDPPREPGLLWGNAGQILTLVGVWRAIGERGLLDAALTRGARLRDDFLPGTLAAETQRPIPLGLAPGVAGIGIGLLALFTATGDEAWAAPIRQIATFLSSRARAETETAKGAAWPVHTGTDAPTGRQWCVGTPGTALFFAAASEALKDRELCEVTLAAGKSTYAQGDARHNPSLCHGLAGSAELLVALHHLTGDARWLERAAEFGDRAASYRASSPDGDVWSADEPGLVAPNLSTGAAGTGRLFLQLAAPDKVSPLFVGDLIAN